MATASASSTSESQVSKTGGYEEPVSLLLATSGRDLTPPVETAVAYLNVYDLLSRVHTTVRMHT